MARIPRQTDGHLCRSNARREKRLAMSNREFDSVNPRKVVWLDDTGTGEPPTDRVLSLENVSAMFGVSRLALRYYEFRGLIRRRHVHDGVRVYSWADCER